MVYKVLRVVRTGLASPDPFLHWLPGQEPQNHCCCAATGGQDWLRRTLSSTGYLGKNHKTIAAAQPLEDGIGFAGPFPPLVTWARTTKPLLLRSHWRTGLASPDPFLHWLPGQEPQNHCCCAATGGQDWLRRTLSSTGYLGKNHKTIAAAQPLEDGIGFAGPFPPLVTWARTTKPLLLRSNWRTGLASPDPFLHWLPGQEPQNHCCCAATGGRDWLRRTLSSTGYLGKNHKTIAAAQQMVFCFPSLL